MELLLIPLAGLWSMDRSTAFNFMISRPLVVAAVIGGISGNFIWCFAGGILFEIIGLMDMPVGTRISRDSTFAAFVFAYVIAHLPVVTTEYCFFTLIIAYVLVFPATYSIVFTRWINKKLYQRSPHRESFLIWTGQAIAFARGVIVYAGGAVLISWLIEYAAGRLIVPSVSFLWLVIFFCFLAGYFSGFLTASMRLKIALLLLGGAFAWLIL
ncbi:MAG: hypothetical protein LBV04_08265 [Deferribacteraceae bacterium]|jgi:PTS system mannose-specific IIC component|nr:hypothetical protein [Deferribacteraceae bacterium]